MITIQPVNKANSENAKQFWNNLKTVAQTKQRDVRNNILRYFTNSDLRLGHAGLQEIAQKNGIDSLALEAGQFVLFINRKWTGVKLLTAGNGIFYQKTPGGQTLVPSALALIPKYFNGKELDLAGAMNEAIRKDFEKYQRSKNP